MIKELSGFMQSLDPHFRSIGLRAKDGLHILLKIQQGAISLAEWEFTRKKDPDMVFLKKCAALTQLSWCIGMNKLFDWPMRAIHTSSPYCVALKRENLPGGEKYIHNTKTQVFERMGAYFAKGMELVDTESEKQLIKIFERALNTEERFMHWLQLIPDYPLLKDGEYVIFYLDVPMEQYKDTNDRYLRDKLFNTNEYNKKIGEEIYGTSDFFNGFPEKKKFLTHQSAYFDIASRISAQEARDLYDFKNIMGQRILPRPLPIFIHEDEMKSRGKKSLRDASIELFKREAEQGNVIGYREIIESLYEDYHDQFGNYYLLFYNRGEIKDFDFVSKFEYRLQDSTGKPWKVQDWFDVNFRPVIENVFQLQTAVLQQVFNNALVTRTKAGGFQYRYFDEIDAAYCKSDVTFLLVQQYRKAFYDFIYKSKRQAVSQHMFDLILQASILEDIRLDEIKNNFHTQERYIRQKMNIWFSLSDHFNLLNTKINTTMGSRLEEHRGFVRRLTKREGQIETDDQYAFSVGQVIRYLLSKSKTADRSYKRLEPFLQHVHSRELNKAISRMFDTYKHETFSTNFREPFAAVMAYETKANIRDLIPTMLAGIFSTNELFSSREEETAVAIIEETEEQI